MLLTQCTFFQITLMIIGGRVLSAPSDNLAVMKELPVFISGCEYMRIFLNKYTLMAYKLNVYISDDKVIGLAKKKAKNGKKSLSSIIEEYLKEWVEYDEENLRKNLPPALRTLWASIDSLPHEISREKIRNYRLKRHLTR